MVQAKFIEYHCGHASLVVLCDITDFYSSEINIDLWFDIFKLTMWSGCVGGQYFSNLPTKTALVKSLGRQEWLNCTEPIVISSMIVQSCNNLSKHALIFQ